MKPGIMDFLFQASAAPIGVESSFAANIGAVDLYHLLDDINLIRLLPGVRAVDIARVSHGRDYIDCLVEVVILSSFETYNLMINLLEEVTTCYTLTPF
jgi:hypothetical protein